MRNLLKHIIEEIFDYDELHTELRNAIESRIDYESIAKHFIDEYNYEIQEIIEELVEDTPF